MDISRIQKELEKFAKERDWNQFHSPKNLAMALSGQADSGAPDAGGEVPSWIEDERDKNTKNLTTVMHSVAKGAGLLSSHLEARAQARRELVDTCSKTYDVSR